MPFSSLKAFALDLVLPCFVALARDISDCVTHGPSLIIAPHQDDDILSCGAAIARARRAGQPVKVIFVTDGSASSTSKVITPAELAARRRIEAVDALTVLGCKEEDIYFLDVADNTTTTHIRQIAERLLCVIEEFNPAQIFSPYTTDPHPDHVAVGLAVNSLVERFAIHCRVFEYPRFQMKSAATHLLNPALWQQLRRIGSRDLLPLKRSALAKHRSQCENLTGEDQWQTLPEPWMKMFFQSAELFIEKNVPIPVRFHAAPVHGSSRPAEEGVQ